MRPANLVIIMSDEHNPKIMGCAGHEIVRTPNLDRLAAGGTMFSSAYTTCPVCVPARAAFAVGNQREQLGLAPHPAGGTEFRERLGPVPALIRRDTNRLAYGCDPPGTGTGGLGVFEGGLRIVVEQFTGRHQMTGHRVGGRFVQS